MTDGGPTDDDTERSYKVGYGRPPAHSRFQPGVSGNRKGRPKGRRNLKHDLQEELSERLTVREGDRQLRLTKQRAIIKSTIAKAIKGDARAQAQAYGLLLRAFGIDDELRQVTVVDARDAKIISAFLARKSGGRP